MDKDNENRNERNPFEEFISLYEIYAGILPFRREINLIYKE